MLILSRLYFFDPFSICLNFDVCVYTFYCSDNSLPPGISDETSSVEAEVSSSSIALCLLTFIKCFCTVDCAKGSGGGYCSQLGSQH